MEELNVRIYETYVTDKALDRMSEELSKNENFVIDDNNITKFVNCESILGVLKENKIKHKIVVDDEWSGMGKIPQYDLKVYIYISQRDYALYKYLFQPEVGAVEYEPEEIAKYGLEEEYDPEDAQVTKNIDLVGKIFIVFITLTIGIPILLLGISIIQSGDIAAGIGLIIVVDGILLALNKSVFAKKKKEISK